jgi:hypothetical protein
MVARRLSLALALLVVPAVLAAPRAADAHPLHTTLTELSYDASARVLTATLRVFADDFSAAVVGARAGGPVVIPPDSAMLRYVTGRFSVTGRGSGRVVMRWCGVRKEGVVLFLCLRGAAPGSFAGLTMTNGLLTEVFPDQVNIVQASIDGRRRTLLFTPRDGAKPLT